MLKENLLNIVNDLNSTKDELISLANKNKNSYFHLSDIIFKMKKQEMYRGQLPLMVNVLEISLKRCAGKKKNNIKINVDDPGIIDKLFDWYLPHDIQINIFKCISKFSQSLFYVEETGYFVNK